MVMALSNRWVRQVFWLQSEPNRRFNIVSSERKLMDHLAQFQPILQHFLHKIYRSYKYNNKESVCREEKKKTKESQPSSITLPYLLENI